jgi:cold shock protein
MAEGTIKTLTDRGFGFIWPDDGREDEFFHQSALVGVTLAQLRQGDRVTYTAENGPAARVRAPWMYACCARNEALAVGTAGITPRYCSRPRSSSRLLCSLILPATRRVIGTGWAAEMAGITAQDIDTVILTHGHADHIGGNADDAGHATFPNARYVMCPNARYVMWQASGRSGRTPSIIAGPPPAVPSPCAPPTTSG